jgi:hypothetical protein
MRRKIYDRRMFTCVGGAVIGTAAKQGAVQRYFDVLSIWRERAVNLM